MAAVFGGTVTVWPVSGQLAAPSSHADGGGRYAASPCLAPVYIEEVESLWLLVCQTVLPGVLRCVTKRWRRMEAGLAE